jgi:segregation and condensation protein A
MDEMTAYRVKLDVFEGPLDLLLYLIRKNEVDIYDIPIDVMRRLNLDVAGEFLVMAATLTHIKSRMLLPTLSGGEEADEEGGDPRKELVERLLEYERFKEAARSLESQKILERDVFIRTPEEDEQDEELELSLFELIEALQQVLSKSSQGLVHEITLERMSIEERITEVLDRLNSSGGEVEFTRLFEGAATRDVIVLTFLALLELMKMRMVKVYQRRAFCPIKIRKI